MSAWKEIVLSWLNDIEDDGLIDEIIMLIKKGDLISAHKRLSYIHRTSDMALDVLFERICDSSSPAPK
jgi:hypothetical protein